MKKIAPLTFQILSARTTSTVYETEVGDVTIKVNDEILKGYNFSGASQEFIKSFDGDPPLFFLHYDREIDEMVLDLGGKSYACEFEE